MMLPPQTQLSKPSYHTRSGSGLKSIVCVRTEPAVSAPGVTEVRIILWSELHTVTSRPLRREDGASTKATLVPSGLRGTKLPFSVQFTTAKSTPSVIWRLPLEG